MKFKIRSITFIMMTSLLFIGCSDKNEDDEIKIGFVAGLSGKYSSLGTGVRDGFILAFEDVDYNVNGKKVVITQKDDKQDKSEAKKAIEYFIKNDIKLIVGNTTSSMTKVSLPMVLNKKDMLLLSATASSSYFSSKDDNFLRLQVDNSTKQYIPLAKSLIRKGYKNIFFIGDDNNKVYIDDYKTTLANVIKENGGNEYTDKVDINSPYADILSKYKKTNSDLILVAANAIDSANVIQYLRLKNVKTKVLASGWARTNDFISNGGKSVNGVMFSEYYDDHSKNPKFLEFYKKFKVRFNKEPSTFSAQAYELGQIIIKNLNKSSDITLLKKNILNEDNYIGLQGDIKFDKYGDVVREFFMIEVVNSKYTKIKE